MGPSGSLQAPPTSDPCPPPLSTQGQPLIVGDRTVFSECSQQMPRSSEAGYCCLSRDSNMPDSRDDQQQGASMGTSPDNSQTRWVQCSGLSTWSLGPGASCSGLSEPRRLLHLISVKETEWGRDIYPLECDLVRLFFSWPLEIQLRYKFHRYEKRHFS